MRKGHGSILVVGCAGCTALCLAGGQKEVDELNLRLRAIFRDQGHSVRIKGYTVERQCEMDFIAELDPMVGKYEAIISLACGAGVQFVAERYREIPVYPALNTSFIGVNRDIGWYEEACRSCGDCQLAYTGGICPVTRCAKSIFNGPCGGTRDGMCEVDPETECAWCLIYERLKGQGRLENIINIKAPVKWQNQVQGRVVLDKQR